MSFYSTQWESMVQRMARRNAGRVCQERIEDYEQEARMVLVDVEYGSTDAERIVSNRLNYLRIQENYYAEWDSTKKNSKRIKKPRIISIDTIYDI